MYFGLSEEQQSLENSIKRYLEDNASLDTIKAVAGGDKETAEKVHQGLIDLGISSLLVPEKYGGLELDMLFASVVSGALGSGTAPVPFTGTYVMAPLALSLAGSEVQKEYWLPKIAGGEKIIGIGLSEFVGAREDTAISFSNGTLSGRALFIIDGKNADAFILSDKAGQLFIIDADDSGITKTELTTVDKTRASIELVLNKVKAETLPGSEKNQDVINKVIDAGRLMLSADSLGASQVMLDKAVAYSLERKQFGRQIGSFQAVKHMCAEMAAELEPCHAMVW
ncbi:MAG TPA: acyl-CoA dehydrogenase, partial [Gammaproteobacteria bacterium]|nr:acyl-CoA dehydrogenase [Gammaproteobacteria bacterium]